MKKLQMKVVRPNFGGHSRAVSQTLDAAKKEKLTDVIVLGFDRAGNEVMIGGSMKNKDALWLMQWGMKHVGPT